MDINDDDDDEPIHGDDEDVADDVYNNLLAAAPPQRWTCEACGCNTNIVLSDQNCTICGTSNTPPSNHFGNPFHSSGTYLSIGTMSTIQASFLLFRQYI